ncbi:MAG TPA: hypothetical protein IGS52_16210 [Oscillatoriaceae cyanobacterium M33_DOE_052]|uniref:Uncharacterized protein n=1 Tax=Planktothricoides sp. SpSt-374 TaxID=2282167 RepID=A0A7C3ZZ66_9CYAN|nr:hypothetical protein [Oscillatoriaceae cyanobacterium M33_DOE_052]
MGECPPERGDSSSPLPPLVAISSFSRATTEQGGATLPPENRLSPRPIGRQESGVCRPASPQHRQARSV